MNISKAIDLSHIYNLRNNFTIIGLTGQIGSGCSEVAELLVKGFNKIDFKNPEKIILDTNGEVFKHNSFRKYRIIYNYAYINFKSYTRIKYKEILVLFLLKYSFDELITFLQSKNLLIALEDLFFKLNSSGAKPDFEIEISELLTLKDAFDELSNEYKKIVTPSLGLYDFYFEGAFQPFCDKILHALKKDSRIKRNKLLQIISINLRTSGEPYIFSEPTQYFEPSSENIFTIVELINDIIKSHEKFIDKKAKDSEKEERRTQIVIDDLRNPIEIMFFKHRFSAYYTFAINREADSRRDFLSNKYCTPDTKDIREAFWKEEYDGAKNHEFFKANISACIQQADIHITFIDDIEIKNENEGVKKQIVDDNKSKNEENTSFNFNWKMQLLKYVSLISHPGIITPSPEERCMQVAYTAKHNSGCISRHVGAAITDENFSIKAIGWNTTPEGLIPCVLRNAKDLIDPQITSDKKAFTSYEYGKDFQNELADKYENPVERNNENLMGRNVCFCFKDLKNSYSKDGKNQVHTRSLHAEENAFLQLVKYGGMGINNGKLFTTASPCELCAKKAYQLGIKDIYYIDPYPGISEKQILSSGRKPIKPILFNGAIGNSYHWLYDPIMPFKDELTLLLGNKFDDFATKQEKKANDLMKENKKLQQEKEELQGKLKKFENK